MLASICICDSQLHVTMALSVAKVHDAMPTNAFCTCMRQTLCMHNNIPSIICIHSLPLVVWPCSWWVVWRTGRSIASIAIATYYPAMYTLSCPLHVLTKVYGLLSSAIPTSTSVPQIKVFTWIGSFILMIELWPVPIVLHHTGVHLPGCHDTNVAIVLHPCPYHVGVRETANLVVTWGRERSGLGASKARQTH